MDIYTFTSGGVINLHKAEIKAADGSKHALGHKENELLRLLLRNSPEVVNKHTIVEEVWQRPSISESAVSVAIAKLRKLLRTISESDVEIITAKGLGYRIALSADVIIDASDQVSAPSGDTSNAARSVQERLLSEKGLLTGQEQAADQELLTEEEKACLMAEIQSSAVDASEGEQEFSELTSDVAQTRPQDTRPSLFKPLMVAAFFSVTFMAAGYLYWAYQFTECKTVKLDKTSAQVQVCWSELSERVAMEQLSTQDLDGVGIVLIDKNKDIKLYSAKGERLANELPHD